jgi:hypothetical protein
VLLGERRAKLPRFGERMLEKLLAVFALFKDLLKLKLLILDRFVVAKLRFKFG